MNVLFISRSLSLFFIFIVILPITYAQSRKSSIGKIKPDRPSIYLTVESEGGRQNKGVNDRAQGEIRLLRLHNNLKVAIQLHVSGEERGHGDVSLYFDLLDQKGNVVESRPCHFCSLIMLKSGKSILFSLPKEFVRSDYEMSLQFSYEWEVNDPVIASREPIHKIFFRFDDLKLELPKAKK